MGKKEHLTFQKGHLIFGGWCVRTPRTSRDTPLECVTYFHGLGRNELFLPGMHWEINLLLLSRRAVFRCMHKNWQKKEVPTNWKKEFPNSNYLQKQTFKIWIVQINFVEKITEWNYLFTFETLRIVLSTFFLLLFIFIISLFSYCRCHPQSPLHTFFPFASNQYKIL